MIALLCSLLGAFYIWNVAKLRLHVSVHIAKRGLFAISVLTILSRVLIDNNGRWLPGLPQEKMTNSIA